MSERKKHYFSIEDAKKFGVPAATFLANIRHWISVNKSSRRNMRDGRYWTYNSREDFRKLMPYFSEEQIKTIIKNLKKAGVLITGNFNK